MNLKSIIKNKKIRRNLLRIINWMPDNFYLSIQYWISLGRLPNLKHPTRFTEKIQLYKMYYRNDIMLECANKFTFRKYVESLNIPNCYLPNLYLHTEDTAKIDISSLPREFVIKTSDGGNGENVFIVKDKKSIDWKTTKTKIDNWKNKHYEIYSREWAYSGNKATIFLVEELLKDNNTKDGGLIDYKFFCFNGEVKFFKIDHSRFNGHRANYFMPNGDSIKVDECSCPADSTFSIPSGVNIKEMIDVAEKLAIPFPFVRVDLYNIEGKIYAGELTFYPMSGFGKFNPDNFDVKAGEYFSLY